jgi:hypothetical protein
MANKFHIIKLFMQNNIIFYMISDTLDIIEMKIGG